VLLLLLLLLLGQALGGSLMQVLLLLPVQHCMLEMPALAAALQRLR
jgi:hypothetical protein